MAIVFSGAQRSAPKRTTQSLKFGGSSGNAKRNYKPAPPKPQVSNMAALKQQEYPGGQAIPAPKPTGFFQQLYNNMNQPVTQPKNGAPFWQQPYYGPKQTAPGASYPPQYSNSVPGIRTMGPGLNQASYQYTWPNTAAIRTMGPNLPGLDRFYVKPKPRDQWPTQPQAPAPQYAGGGYDYGYNNGGGGGGYDYTPPLPTWYMEMLQWRI